MLIRFFKTNQPASFIALPLFAAALWLGSWIKPGIPEPVPPMPLYALVSYLNSIPYLSEVLAFLLVISQGFYLNYIINKYDLRDSRERSNFLAALFCIFFLSLFHEFRTLLPQHFAGLFLLLMLDRIFSSYRTEQAFSNCFDAGLLAGIASLFYFPSIVFFLLVWTGFVVLRAFNWREWLISFFGLLVPWLIIITYYFWFGRLDDFFSLQVASVFAPHYFQFGSPDHALLIFIFTGLCLVPAMLGFMQAMTSGKIKTNKFFLLFLWFLVFAVISGLVFPIASYTHFTLAAVPLAVIFSNWFLTLKKSWIAESLFAVLLGAFIYAEVMGLR